MVFIARLTKEQQNRKNTKDALMEALEKNKTTAQFYMDLVEEYMDFYDNLTIINNELKQNKDKIIDADKYTKLIKEKRLITKEMRGILAFLKIIPNAVNNKDDDSDEDEKL